MGNRGNPLGSSDRFGRGRGECHCHSFEPSTNCAGERVLDVAGGVCWRRCCGRRARKPSLRLQCRPRELDAGLVWAEEAAELIWSQVVCLAGLICSAPDCWT